MYKPGGWRMPARLRIFLRPVEACWWLAMASPALLAERHGAACVVRGRRRSYRPDPRAAFLLVSHALLTRSNFPVAARRRWRAEPWAHSRARPERLWPPPADRRDKRQCLQPTERRSAVRAYATPRQPPAPAWRRWPNRPASAVLFLGVSCRSVSPRATNPLRRQASPPALVHQREVGSVGFRRRSPLRRHAAPRHPVSARVPRAAAGDKAPTAPLRRAARRPVQSGLSVADACSFGQYFA